MFRVRAIGRTYNLHGARLGRANFKHMLMPRKDTEKIRRSKDFPSERQCRFRRSFLRPLRTAFDLVVGICLRAPFRMPNGRLSNTVTGNVERYMRGNLETPFFVSSAARFS